MRDQEGLTRARGSGVGWERSGGQEAGERVALAGKAQKSVQTSTFLLAHAGPSVNGTADGLSGSGLDIVSPFCHWACGLRCCSCNATVAGVRVRPRRNMSEAE
jgi:hypothetical protein